MNFLKMLEDNYIVFGIKNNSIALLLSIL